MKTSFKMKPIKLYLTLGLNLAIASCGSSTEDVENVMPPIEAKPVSTIGQEDNSKSLVQQSDLKKLAVDFVEFFNQNSSLNLKFDVYNDLNSKNNMSIFRYDKVDDSKEVLSIKRAIDAQNADINIELSTIETWQKFLSMLKEHQEFYSSEKGEYKIGDKSIDTLKFKNIPPAVLLSFINKFYLSEGTLQPDKLLADYKASKKSYPVKLVLMLQDINNHRKCLKSGYLQEQVNKQKKIVEFKNQIKTINQQNVVDRFNKYNTLIEKQNEKLAHPVDSPVIIRQGNVEKRIFVDNFVYIPDDLKKAPDVNLINCTVYNDLPEDQSFEYSDHVSIIWDSLGLSSVVDPYKFMDQVYQIELDEYIKYLMQGHLQVFSDNDNQGAMLNNADLTLFNTYLEVDKKSGVPLKMVIEYNSPINTKKLDPVFTANRLIVEIY